MLNEKYNDNCKIHILQEGVLKAIMFEKKKPRTVTIGVRFTEDENKKIDEVAKKVGANKSDFVRAAILEKIKEVENN